MPTFKLLGYGLGILLSLGAAVWAYRAVQNYFIGIDNIRVELSNERDRANRAEVSLGSLRETESLKRKQAAELVKIRAESQAKIDAIRGETQKYKDVLDDRERLKRLTLAKPGLVERLANKAGEKRLAELETTLNTD